MEKLAVTYKDRCPLDIIIQRAIFIVAF